MDPQEESAASVDELPPHRSRALRYLSVLFSAVALTGVIVWASQQDAPQLPSGSGELLALAGAIGIYGVATALRGERWWWLARDADVNLARKDAYGLTVVSYMGNNVLPARAGDAMRVLLIPGRPPRAWRPVVGTLITERLLDVLVLLTLFAVLAFLVLPDVATPEGDALLVAGGVGATLFGVFTAALWLNRERSWARRAIGWIAPLTLSTRRLRGRHAANVLAQTVAIWTLEVLTYLLVADTVGLEISVAEAAYVIAVSSVFLLIPSGPGYVGTLDAGILFALDAIGASGSEALSYLLMARFVVFVPVTFAGLALFLWRYRELPRMGGQSA